MLKFIHTSDWQLGAGFGAVPGDKGAYLRTQRLETLERVGRAAEEEDARFILVAGDLFDAHSVENEVVTRACEKIGRFSVPVYAIPGNHDFAMAPESVYRRDRFRQRKPENLHILDTPEPVDVPDADALILPCPLVQRLAVTDPTTWIDAASGRDLRSEGYRIGLAHGSIQNFEPEAGGTTPNLIDPDVVERGELDYLALGDWHGVKQIGERIWYSGTPEPDRFKDNASGAVLVVELDGPRAVPRVKTREVGSCRWLRHTAVLHGEGDVTELDNWFTELQDPARTLVRLEVDGVLNMTAMERFDRLLDTQGELLVHLRRRGPGVKLRPSDEEIDAMMESGLTGRVVAKLRGTIEAGGEEADRAAMALQLLFQMTRRPAEGCAP